MKGKLWEGRATNIVRHAPGLGKGPSLRGEAKFQSGMVWIPIAVGHCRPHETKHGNGGLTSWSV